MKAGMYNLGIFMLHALPFVVVVALFVALMMLLSRDCHRKAWSM
jgi:hypothetical protein